MMAPNSTGTAASSKSAIFWRRLGSSILLWSLVLGALFSGNATLSDYVFLLVMLGLSALGLIEFYQLVERTGLRCHRNWGVLGGLLLIVCSFFYLSGRSGAEVIPAKANDFETSFLILFVLGLGVRQLVSSNPQHGLIAMATTLLGLMYVPWLLNFIQKITFFPGIDGRFYLLYFLVVTKLSDSGAYAVGSLWGRHKVIPRISPGKTWEGIGGAVAASTLASLVFVWLAPDRLAGITILHALILGILLSCAAIVGDLIESLLKREAGIKDSGAWFPGIGGILDLTDSLLFNAPLMYLYLRHILTA
ncbi:MAG TPA: CDP-archaeol synthase [Candidatus Paceibacterota bacterium]|nr:CDP-archaeol synthase [Verrucomicrobiota bacterium]HRY49800.1 CDP-archaeol synthase [Candidatus Paceibacterota bacterium]HSA02182.1 CDP-archaeol synthase [Candidatus Paceibacterota bacterium]